MSAVPETARSTPPPGAASPDTLGRAGQGHATHDHTGHGHAGHGHDTHDHAGHGHDTHRTGPVLGRWALPVWTPPFLLAAAALAGCVLLRLWNPGDEGTVLCPFKATTGWDCPGCGMTRATYALTRADLPAAVDHNLFILPLAGIFGYTYVRWLGQRTRWWDFPALRFPTAAVWVLSALLIIFWLVRNLGPFAFLESGLN